MSLLWVITYKLALQASGLPTKDEDILILWEDINLISCCDIYDHLCLLMQYFMCHACSSIMKYQRSAHMIHLILNGSNVHFIDRIVGNMKRSWLLWSTLNFARF